jgi:hypothetical protein
VSAHRLQAEKLYTSVVRATNNVTPFFVVSFCRHEEGTQAFEHGLLSQWRGYAEAGGFAIEFDEEKLDTLGEEREYRIVVVCIRPSKIAEGETRTPKWIKFRHRNGLIVPYIELFETSNQRIPIIDCVLVMPRSESVDSGSRVAARNPTRLVCPLPGCRSLRSSRQPQPDIGGVVDKAP